MLRLLVSRNIKNSFLEILGRWRWYVVCGDTTLTWIVCDLEGKAGEAAKGRRGAGMGNGSGYGRRAPDANIPVVGCDL
jgi:hypothetical protein